MTTNTQVSLALFLTLGSCIIDEGDQSDTNPSAGEATTTTQGTSHSTSHSTGASAATGDWDPTGTSGTTGPEVDPLPPVDCNKLPPLPLTYKKLEFVPGCEDFTFDREGNLACITKARNYVKVPFGGPEQLVVPNLGGADQFAFTRGARFLPNGDLIVADPATSSLIRVSSDGSVQRVLSNIPDPNGIAVDFSGLVYLSSLSGQIWKIDPEQQTYEILYSDADPNTRFDGITLSLDYNSLFFNTEDRLEIFRLLLPPASSMPNTPELVATIMSEQGTSIPPLLDGMTVDECGNLYIAELHGIIHRLSVTGELGVVADMSEHYPAFITALNFGSGIGGWNAHTLYAMIIQGGMYAIDIGVGGKVEPFLDIANEHRRRPHPLAHEHP